MGARPAGGLSVWGAEGSFAGLTANMPEAEVVISSRSSKVQGKEIKLKKRI